MGNGRKIRKYRMGQRILQLITCMLAACCFLFGMGAYEILNFPQDTRSLSLHNTASAYDRSLLRNNPAALSLAAEVAIYSPASQKLEVGSTVK